LILLPGAEIPSYAIDNGRPTKLLMHLASDDAVRNELREVYPNSAGHTRPLEISPQLKQPLHSSVDTRQRSVQPATGVQLARNYCARDEVAHRAMIIALSRCTQAAAVIAVLSAGY